MTSTDNGLTLIYKNMLNLTENITNNNNGIILLKDIIFYKNLFISGTTTINDISLNSTLSIVGNINTNNIYINTNICSNNYINHNNVFVVNNLYLTGNSIINKLTANSNLDILGYGIMNTIQTTLLNVSSNTVLLNITSNSNINIIQNITSLSNISINSNLNVSNNTILNNVTVVSNLYVSNMTYINLPISITSNLYNFGKLVTTNMTVLSNLNIVGNVNINNSGVFNNISIVSNISINNVLVVKNIYANSIIFDTPLDYNTNTIAIGNNLSSWDYYRTGDILKIVIDNVPPYVSNKTTNNIIIKGNNYTEIGLNVYDNMSNIADISVFITSIVNDSINYLPNSIQITTTTILNQFNSLLLGNHVITYTIYDKEKNYATLNKTVSVILDTIPPIITLIGSDIIYVKLNDLYIEQGATVSNNVTFVSTGIVNTSTIGKYIITYTATNLSYKTTTIIRIVYVLNKLLVSPFDFIYSELTDIIITNATSNVITNGLIFYLKVSNMNTLNNSWFDTNNQYEFIPHTIANKYSSITKIQNNNGWGRSDLAGWVLKDNTILLSKDWTNGLTLEQWIYIDYNYVPSTTKMLLVGQGSLYSTYDYGLCLNQSLYPYTTYAYNVLSFATNTVIKNEGTGLGYINLNEIRGKWVNISVTISTTTVTGNKTLNIYLNGLLRITLSQTQWLNNWPNIPLNTNKFTIGCDNNGIIQSESLNTIFFGDTLLYNRMLYNDEILNNYNYNKTKYITPIINKVNYITRIPTYNLSMGYMSQSQIDLNNIKTSTSWTVELWIYPEITSWTLSNINILNINNNYLSFGIDSTGKPYFLYNTILITSVSSNLILNKWNHLVYQKNSNTEFEIFGNGISLKKFTIINTALIFPTFGTLDLNNLTIGNTSSYWNGLISQVKISYTKLYTSNFTPVIDTILDLTTVFLLDDNFINIANKKSLVNYNSVIDDINKPNIPKIILNGDNPLTLYKDISNYVDLGATIVTTLRTNIPPIVIQNNVNVNIPNLYINIYSITGIDYVNYVSRNINVILRPSINLNGSSIIYLTQTSIYVEQGVTITNSLSQIITPIISGSVDINTVGTYTITYTVLDSYNNTASINRTVIVTLLPI